MKSRSSISSASPNVTTGITEKGCRGSRGSRYPIHGWPLTDEPFDRSRFARKHEEEVLGVSITVSSPEDTILAKLKWAKASGGSEKQFMDALRVYEVQFGKLDISYIEEWAAALGVEQEYIRLTKEAETIPEDDSQPS